MCITNFETDTGQPMRPWEHVIFGHLLYSLTRCVYFRTAPRGMTRSSWLPRPSFQTWSISRSHNSSVSSGAARTDAFAILRASTRGRYQLRGASVSSSTTWRSIRDRVPPLGGVITTYLSSGERSIRHSF